MQTNLHRVSEFAVTANQTADDGSVETRTSVKRVREHDTETESDADDIVSGSTIPVALTDLNSQGIEAIDFWHDSSKSEAAQLDTTVFLSFDWDNEEPYERAVERYYRFIVQIVVQTLVPPGSLINFDSTCVSALSTWCSLCKQNQIHYFINFTSY